MTELELYKYVNNNQIEWHRQDNDGVNDVLICPLIFQIDEFSKLVKGFTSDGFMECRLMDGYFVFWMKDLCDYYGIDMDKVFCGEEQ